VTLASRGDSYGFGCGGGWFAGCGGQGGGLVVLVNRGREGGGTMALNDSHGAWRNRGSGRGWGQGHVSGARKIAECGGWMCVRQSKSEV